DHKKSHTEQRRGPPEGWVMCNVAYKWSKEKSMVGAACVHRNVNRLVLCHSRRKRRRQADNYFVGSRKHEIRMVMSSLQANSRNVLELLINLVLGLRLAFQVMTALSGCQGWLVNTMHKDPNRGASFIAESVINMGPPQWLRSFFDNEEGFL
ncbi:hypothetical protein HID58_006156, partial [Brassica napus]